MPLSKQVLKEIIEGAGDIAQSDSFLIALISEEEFDEFPSCPHCGSVEGSITLDEAMNLDNHVAALHICQDEGCGQVFMVCGYPTLFQVAHPVYLQVVMKEGQNPIAEVVASDIAKNLLAQAWAEKKLEVMD